MQTSPRQRLLELARQTGVLRARDLADAAVPRTYLRRLLDEGLLQRASRGLYYAADTTPTEHHGLAEVAKRVPHGVICLLSALQFHGLTTQAPFEVWLAVANSARRPKFDFPPLRVMHFSAVTLDYGVESHVVEGVPIRVFSIAKTVADCFKFRNKIGLDVALEALRDCMRRRKATVDELFHAAQVCRVSRVIRPYLEAIT